MDHLEILQAPIDRAKGDNSTSRAGRYGALGHLEHVLRDQSACARSIGAYNSKIRHEKWSQMEI
ncbi:MAG TPA: hypothetical protein VH593_10760 [Ktedonobacteraceae bacterium]|jgi:hypothetical protein